MEDAEDDLELKQLFQRASGHLTSIAGSLPSSDLLYLYGRYKQANEGPCNTPKPGFFDFRGKEKWEAWRSLGDLSSEVAMTEYVAMVDKLSPDWRSRADTQRPAKSGFGVTVSTMCAPEEGVPNEDKSIFDWCKEGDTAKLQTLLNNKTVDVNQPDGTGMCLIHWACDRGSEDTLKLLLDNGAQVNALDQDQQTPLHYAASCGHHDVISLLLQSGADTSCQDADGMTAAECADSSDIRSLLEAR